MAQWPSQGITKPPFIGAVHEHNTIDRTIFWRGGTSGSAYIVADLSDTTTLEHGSTNYWHVTDVDICIRGTAQVELGVITAVSSGSTEWSTFAGEYSTTTVQRHVTGGNLGPYYGKSGYFHPGGSAIHGSTAIFGGTGAAGNTIFGGTARPAVGDIVMYISRIDESPAISVSLTLHDH